MTSIIRPYFSCTVVESSSQQQKAGTPLRNVSGRGRAGIREASRLAAAGVGTGTQSDEEEEALIEAAEKTRQAENLKGELVFTNITQKIL